MLGTMTSPTPGEGRLLDGRYRLGALIGVGGVAEVYRAQDERLARAVAVKLFRGDVAEQLHRHEDEMRTLARLNHPSLVTVFDAGTDELTQRPYLVMELVDGSTLSEHLRLGPMAAARVAEIGTAVADALAYVHGQGLVHRDVKPANVLLGSGGRTYLADFGIARLVDAQHVTQAGDVLGTPAYFAPEQVTGEPVGPPADVYALGLVLLECMTGRREYDGASIETAMARLDRPPQLGPTLPAGWRDLLLGMTARQPSSRLSAAQVVERLRRLGSADDSTVAMAMPRSDPPTTVMPAAGAAPPVARPGRRRMWIAVAIVVVLIIAGTVAAVVAANHQSGGATGASCGSGTPPLSGRLETDMRNLENLSCR